MAKYFVTRSAVEASRSDEDAAMQHQQIGPFTTAEAARQGFATYLAEGIQHTATAPATSVLRKFLPQYALLAAALMTAPPFTRVFEAEGVRWTIREV